jgi:hypothetical protein
MAIQCFSNAWSRLAVGGLLLMGTWSSELLSAEAPEVFNAETYLRSSRDLQGNFQFDWQHVSEFDFKEAAVMDQFQVVAGEWVIENGALVASSGDKNRAILVASSGHDPVRVEFEATLSAAPNGRVGDISILLNAGTEKYFTSGYTLTSGSFWNHCTTFYRLGRPIAHTEHSPIEAEKKNRVVLEYHQGHIRYWLNERILLEAWDPQPIAMEGAAWIGVRTYGTRMRIENLKISRADVPTGRKRKDRK